MNTKKLFFLTLALTLPLIYTMFGGKLPGEMYTVAALASIVQFYSGARFYRGAWSAFKHRAANMDTLVAVGTSVAYLYSVWALGFGGEVYFEISSLLITFILRGKWLEELTKGRASKAIEKLLDLQAKEATVMK